MAAHIRQYGRVDRNCETAHIAVVGGSKLRDQRFYRFGWRRIRAPTPMETSPMMAIAEGMGFSVNMIVMTANPTISPPTIIIAVPRLFQVSAISASFHAGF